MFSPSYQCFLTNIPLLVWGVGMVHSSSTTALSSLQSSFSSAEPRCSGTTLDSQIAKTSKPSLNDRRKIVSFDQFVFSVDRFLGLFYAGHFPRHVFDFSAIRGFQKTNEKLFSLAHESTNEKASHKWSGKPAWDSSRTSISKCSFFANNEALADFKLLFSSWSFLVEDRSSFRSVSTRFNLFSSAPTFVLISFTTFFSSDLPKIRVKWGFQIGAR